MAITLYYYRGLRFCKDYFIKFLTYLFYGESKGVFRFYDNTRKTVFSNTPTFIKAGSWDLRQLPAVLVSGSRGNYVQRSFTKDFISQNDAGDSNTYIEYGGDISLTVTLESRANSIEESDNLLDICGTYLASPIAKDYFMKQYITIPGDISISDSKPIYEPSGIEHPIYGGSLDIPVMGSWRMRDDQEVNVNDFFVEISASIDL